VAREQPPHAGLKERPDPRSSVDAILNSTILHSVFIPGAGTGGKTCQCRAMRRLLILFVASDCQCRKARVYSSHGFQPVEGERRTTLVSLSPSPFEGRLNGVQAPRWGLDKRRRERGAGGGPRVGNPWLENSRPPGADGQARPVDVSPGRGERR